MVVVDNVHWTFIILCHGLCFRNCFIFSVKLAFDTFWALYFVMIWQLFKQEVFDSKTDQWSSFSHRKHLDFRMLITIKSIATQKKTKAKHNFSLFRFVQLTVGMRRTGFPCELNITRTHPNTPEIAIVRNVSSHDDALELFFAFFIFLLQNGFPRISDGNDNGQINFRSVFGNKVFPFGSVVVVFLRIARSFAAIIVRDGPKISVKFPIVISIIELGRKSPIDWYVARYDLVIVGKWPPV